MGVTYFSVVQVDLNSAAEFVQLVITNLVTLCRNTRTIK